MYIYIYVYASIYPPTDSPFVSQGAASPLAIPYVEGTLVFALMASVYVYIYNVAYATELRFRAEVDRYLAPDRQPPHDTQRAY